MKKPRLKLSHHVIFNEAGDICIGEIEGSSFIVRSPSPAFIDLLFLLDGSRTIPRLIRDFRHRNPDIEEPERQIEALIDEMERLRLLDDAGFHSDSLTPVELELYDRQMLYFSQVDPEGQPAFVYQERLKKQRVAVLGLGGWGTWVSLTLALQGFGLLRLVDGDIVEMSNLNRQVLYQERHVGVPKAIAAAETLRVINPHISLDPLVEFVGLNIEQVERILDSVTLIFLCWANLAPFMRGSIAEIVHAVALERGIPVIEFGGDPFEIFLGPIYRNDGNGPCLNCAKRPVRQDWYSDKVDAVNQFRRARLDHKYDDGGRRVDAWQSAPSLSVMTGFAVDQAVKLVTGCEPTALDGKRIRMSMRSLEQSTLPITRDPECTWCSAKNDGESVSRLWSNSMNGHS